MKVDFINRPIWIKIFVVLFSICLLGATYNHINDLIKGGFLPYTKWMGAPIGLNIYWTSLTFLNPLAVVLLFLSLRVGIYLLNIIIISDVIINMYSCYHYYHITFFENTGLQQQLAFMIVVVVISPFIYLYSKAK